MIPHLLYNKACCLLSLGDRDGSLALFKEALVVFSAFRMFEHKEVGRKFVKEKFGVDL